MKVAMISGNCEHHGRNMVEVCNEHIPKRVAEFTFLEYDDTFDTGWELEDIGKYDVLFNVGYFVPIGIYLATVQKAEPDVKIVNCWVGSDILQNLGHFHTGMDQHVRAAKNFVNVCDAPMFKKELRTFFKIKAGQIKSCPKNLLEPTPLPEQPMFSIYMPQHRAPFYNFEMMVEVASLNAHIAFTMLGCDSPPPSVRASLKNTIWAPWLNPDEVEKVIQNSTGIIRAPLHDGFSIFLLETMSAGRWPITNVPNIPHTEYCTAMLDIAKAVDETSRYDVINYEGAQWVKDNYSPQHMADSIRDVLAKVR